MMICSERTRGSWGASPRLWQRAGLVLACLIGGLGVWTQSAAAQHVNYFWSVVQGSTTLLPGESVTLQLNARRTPDFPETSSYIGGRFTVLISGWGAADALATNTDGTFGTENSSDTTNSYLGRRPHGNGKRVSFRSPFALNYMLQKNNPDLQELVTDLPEQGIDHASFRLFDAGDPANPTDFFRIKFVAGDSLGTRAFETAFTISQVADQFNLPENASFVNGSIEVFVIPSSSVISLLIVSSVIFWKRSR